LPPVYLRAALLIFASEAGYKLLINEMVFEETLDVLKRKFPELRNRFFGLLSIGNFSILKNPEKRELKIVKNLIEEKDAPILVSAIKHADYLLTLDKGFFKKRSYKFCQESQTSYFATKRVYSIPKTKNKEMRIYNYARSPLQILQDYNAGLSAHFK
jgi:hypothetical protein